MKVKDMLDYFFNGMNVYQLMVWFFIFSFLGWGMECIVIRKERGYWENRGFAKLPFCVIYGFGVFNACILFKPIEHNYIALYIAGAIGATIFEYLTAVVMQKLFGEVWWDYTYKKFNYKGILCLESTLGWGVVALFVFGYLNNAVSRMVMSWNTNLTMLLGVVLCVSYFIDFSYHFVQSYNRNKYDVNEEEMDEEEFDDEEEVRTIRKA